MRREINETLNAFGHDDDNDDCIPLGMIIPYISCDLWVGMGTLYQKLS